MKGHLEETSPQQESPVSWSGEPAQRAVCGCRVSSQVSLASAVGGEGPRDLGPPASFLGLGLRVTREDTAKGTCGQHVRGISGVAKPSPGLARSRAGYCPPGRENGGQAAGGGAGGSELSAL